VWGSLACVFVLLFASVGEKDLWEGFAQLGLLVVLSFIVLFVACRVLFRCHSVRLSFPIISFNFFGLYVSFSSFVPVAFFSWVSNFLGLGLYSSVSGFLACSPR
jgi:polyferredoxin